MNGRAEAWDAGDPRLGGPADRSVLEGLLVAYRPNDGRERRERERMLTFLRSHADCLERSCVEGHFTGSALLLDADGKRALLTHHRKLRRWLQLGGHADGDGNLIRVALREASEESGIEGLRVEPTPIDLDIHAIPARADEPEHLHLDLRFLVHAPPGARERLSEESIELGWFGPEESLKLDLDPSVRRLFEIRSRTPAGILPTRSAAPDPPSRR